MKTKIAVCCLVALSFACTKGAVSYPPERSSPPTPPASGVLRQADIYATLIGGGEKFGDLWIVDQLCSDAAEPVEHKDCVPMSAELKTALLERFPSAQFTSDPQPMLERLMKKGGVTVHWVGPVIGSGDVVQVGSSYWCGGLCGAGSVKVVEFQGGEWKVTGGVGGSWIS